MPGSAVLTPVQLAKAGVAVQKSLARAACRWFSHSTPTNIALSGVLVAAVQWVPSRGYLLGYAKRGDGPSEGVCILQAVLSRVWDGAVAALKGLSDTMGRTPFQAALLTEKLLSGQVMRPSDVVDTGGGEVAALAAAAAAGTPDPAVEVVLTAHGSTLRNLLVLQAASQELLDTLAVPAS